MKRKNDPVTTIAFNTGRTYTEFGQRIAARWMDGGMFMVDIDRGLYYFLPGCPISKTEVLAAYDANRVENYPPSTVQTGDYVAFNEMRQELEAEAAKLPSAFRKD